jgi:hypothetical protein
MSTEGLAGIEALRQALHENAEDVRAKAAQAVREADEVTAEKRRIAEQAAADAEEVAIAARRIEQEHIDAQLAHDARLGEIDHRASQRAYILTGVRPSAPATNDPGLYTHQGAQDQPRTDAPEPPAPDQADEVTVVEQSHRGTSYWIGVLVGALIGLLVGLAWQPLRAHTHSIQWLVTLAWIVAWVLLLAWVGGRIGIWLHGNTTRVRNLRTWRERRRRSRGQHQ